jgi:DNA-binding winged helix-turn-helix (wHTH) protein
MSQDTLNSAESHSSAEFAFEGYTVRSDELIVRYRGHPLLLAPKVVQTLIALLDRAGRVVSKNELLSVVWGDAQVEESNLSQNIYTLRQQFQCASATSLIETLPRRGYRFTGAVSRREAARALPRSEGVAYRLAAAAAALLVAGIALIGTAMLKPPPPVSQLPDAAANAYALGWYYFRSAAESDLRASVAHFEHVSQLVPDDPRGYAGQAIAFVKLADLYGDSPSGVTATVSAEKLARKALALDGRSSFAHAAMGFVEFDLDGDSAAAASDLQEAIARDPQSAIAHMWYGALLLWGARPSAARAELERAASIDATLPALDYLLARDYYVSRDFGNEAQLVLAAAHEERGEYGAAIGALKGLPAGSSARIAASGTLAHVYSSMGKRDRAAGELLIVERLSAGDQNRPALTALAYAANGRFDEAFAWLSRLSVTDRRLVALDPRFDALHRDRRFMRWLRG